jgi:uncharacterized protein
MPKTALIVWGGWDGHQPKEVATIFHRVLKEEQFDVEVSDSLNNFDDVEKLSKLSLIVPVWTCGQLSQQQERSIMTAVERGTGIGGCHGGMCDAFRNNPGYQFVTGGQWVAHPGNDGTKYPVHIKDNKHPITEGLKDFEVVSEQYYMHVDPANKVLATCPFPVADGPHVPNGHVEMPTVWVKHYGKGRVFYNALGHQANVVESEPCLTIMRRGFVWAAR